MVHWHTIKNYSTTCGCDNTHAFWYVWQLLEHMKTNTGYWCCVVGSLKVSQMNYICFFTKYGLEHFGCMLFRIANKKISTCSQSPPINLNITANLGLVRMGCQVPSPIHANKTQQASEVPTFEPQEIIKIRLIIIELGSWLFYVKKFLGLVLRVGSSFCSTQLSTEIPSLTFKSVVM